MHAIFVTAHGAEELPGANVWGVISDADRLRAAQVRYLDEQAARTIAATPVLTVTVGEELVKATQLMIEHEVSHLIVVEPRSARPVGVLSTLDIARALAGFPERHPVPQ